MTSNGNNMMKDYLNEMQKYVMSSTDIYSKLNNADEKGFTEGQMNLDNSHLDTKMYPDVGNQMNTSNLDESILMNKDKLFETFMMFLNSQQLVKSSTTEGRAKNINESQDFAQYQPNNMKKSLDLSIIDLDRSLDKHTISIKTNTNNKEDSTKFNRLRSNSIHINSYMNEDNKIADNHLELNVSRDIQIDNYIQNEEINNNDNNNIIHTAHNEEMPFNANEVMSFDDIPIKPKTTNFLELLEQNLAKEENMRDNFEEGGDEVNVERIRKIRENKANNRRNSALRVQQTGETKKYKYYLQNFNKEFGKEDKAEDNFEEIAPIEKKPAKFKYEDKKKNKKTNIAVQKKISIPQEKNTKNNNTNSTKVSNPSNYHTFNNESLKNSLPSNKRESGSIWSDKTQADNKVDDFINSLPKPNMPKNKKLTEKEDKLNISQFATNQDYEIKLVSAPSKVRMNVNKSNNKAIKKPENVTKKPIGNTESKDFRQYYQTNACNEIEIFKDKRISNLDIEDNYKTNAVKLDNINFDNLDLNELDDLSEDKEIQIEKVKEELHKNKRIDEEAYCNKRDTNEMNKEDSFDQDKEDIEDDGDDDRDILRMYEEKIQNNSSKSIMREEKSDINVKEDNGSYKKPEQSKIINKYFKPLIKEPTKSKLSENFDSENKSPSSNKINLTETNYQEMINEKINELNKEIEKMRKENEKVNKLKTEYEKLTNKLNREIEEFHFKKEKETEEFELWKEEEMIKMEKDKKVHLRNTKLLQNMPNRKEREEIDLLKEQVLKLQEEMKAKDHRNKLANDRTKRQLEDALKKNEEKSKEIKYMEEMRVRNMQNSNSNSANRNRAPSKTIHTDNPSNSNNESNISNIKLNSHLMSNKSRANLVSPQNRKIPVPKEKVSLKSNPNQQQQRSSVRNNSIKSEASDHKQCYDTFDDYAEDFDNVRNNSENSNEDDVVSSSVHQVNDYYDIKKSSKDEESEIKMNKGKVLKTANSLTKNDSKQTSFRQAEESVNKMNQLRSTIPNYNGRLETATDNKQASKKDRTSVSPKKQEKKEANYNILVKNRDDYNEIYDMVFIDKYHGKAAQNVRLLKQEFSDDGKIIKLYENMKKVVRFPSGVVKELFEDGYQVTYFNNQDIKQVYPDKKEVYLFAENKTLQFKFPDGLHVFKFEGGLLEKHYPDGTKVVNYIDGRIRNVYADGYEETFFPDGSLQKIDKNGLVTFDYEDGLKDTIYPDGLKIREFPDGKVIKVFPDGKIENYYK